MRLFTITAVTALALGQMACRSGDAQWGDNLSRLRGFGQLIRAKEIQHEGVVGITYDYYFGIEEEYDDRVKYYEKETQRYYDWLIFPDGVRLGAGEMIYAMSPSTVRYAGKECRMVLFRSLKSKEYSVNIVSDEELNRGYRGESYRAEL